MTNAIVPAKRADLATGNQRSTPEQVITILAPVFALFAVEEKIVQLIYVKTLADIAPERLQVAADRALRECRFMPKPAELRELAHEQGEPGPRNDISDEQLAARPAWWQGGRLYRESDQERRERLLRTKDWGHRYGH